MHIFFLARVSFINVETRFGAGQTKCNEFRNDMNKYLHSYQSMRQDIFAICYFRTLRT